MRFLIVEDDFGSRRLMQMMLQSYGPCDVVVDGREAIDAFTLAWEENNPYDVIMLDIMMPDVDGHEALKEIRAAEKEMGILSQNEVKVIMTTALEDPHNVVAAYYQGGANGYVVKPVDRERVVEALRAAGVKV